MVKLHIKKGDESQFLFETTVDTSIEDLMTAIVPVYNGRLKVSRLCAEMESLADHGIMLPPNMQGLTDDQIVDLKLKDEWAEKCTPSQGAIYRKDEIGRRNGQAPNQNMSEMIKKTVKEAKEMISKKKVSSDVLVTLATVNEALDILRGAVMIVYPMNLPPYDPVRMELENNEDLEGTQASKEILELDTACLWWAGKEFLRGKKLMDFIGKNEKTKIIAKIQKKGQGAPSREPVVTEEEQKSMMLHYHRKQEEFKKLEKDSEDAYMDSTWADTKSLSRQMQGLSTINWGPGKR